MLYADDTYLIFKNNDITEIEMALNKNFSILCDWFVDNELGIHFGQYKTKSVLFSSKHKINKSKPLNIQYNDIKIRQYSEVTYLGCMFDEIFTWPFML